MERRVSASKVMRCFVCKNGTVRPGRITYVVERDGHVVVIRDVPAEVCSQCGEEYFGSETAQALYDQAERIFAHGSDVEIAKYAA